MERASVHAHGEQEALRFRRTESEKAGRDLGEEAVRLWVREYWASYLRDRWLEHLRGERFWVELDCGDFGLLQREFRDHTLLLDRVLDRLQAGQQNLDIIRWAAEWGIPMAPLFEILTALDVNSRRLSYRFDHPVAPSVAINPAWLTWNRGTVPGLARSICEESAFDLLPILGDALEEAGCADAIILEHCRSGSPHTGWCWLTDLIMRQAELVARSSRRTS